MAPKDEVSVSIPQAASAAPSTSAARPAHPTHATVAQSAAPPRAETASGLLLPTLIFGIIEIRHLQRELEALEDFMRQTALRQPGSQPALPRLSRLCEALAAENHLNLLQPAHRQTLRNFLVQVEQSAPRVHMSFAADPSSAFTAKIVAWLRHNVQPDTLLEIGLQPTIAAGAMLRTNNKIFDLSLRERFADSEKLLLSALENTAKESAAPQQAALQAAPEVAAQ